MRNFEGFRSGKGFAPVKEGEEFEVTIEAVGAKGDGIAKKDGFVLFVPNTKEGEKVNIRVTKVFRKVGFAEVIGAGEEAKGKKPVKKKESIEEQEEEKQAESTPKEAEEEPEEDTEKEDTKEEEPEESEDTEDFGEEAGEEE